MLEAKSLASAYNPELLDYLLEEGRDVLPPDQRQTALDQLVSALDTELVLRAAQAVHRLVECVVARLRRHAVERQIGLLQRRQDSGQHDAGVELGSRRGDTA